MLENLRVEYNSWVSKYANPHLVFFPYINDVNVTYKWVYSLFDIRELTKLKNQSHKINKNMFLKLVEDVRT
jgi:hypothetical protein